MRRIALATGAIDKAGAAAECAVPKGA